MNPEPIKATVVEREFDFGTYFAVAVGFHSIRVAVRGHRSVPRADVRARAVQAFWRKLGAA